jgi:hypothetical protein
MSAVLEQGSRSEINGMESLTHYNFLMVEFTTHSAAFLGHELNWRQVDSLQRGNMYTVHSPDPKITRTVDYIFGFREAMGAERLNLNALYETFKRINYEVIPEYLDAPSDPGHAKYITDKYIWAIGFEDLYSWWLDSNKTIKELAIFLYIFMTNDVVHIDKERIGLTIALRMALDAGLKPFVPYKKYHKQYKSIMEKEPDLALWELINLLEKWQTELHGSFYV